MKRANINEITSHIYDGYRKVLNTPIDMDNSDFFLNGGNSIKAMELVNYLNKKYSYGITIDVIFRKSSVNELASYIYENMLIQVREIKQMPLSNNVTQQLGIYLLSQQDIDGISYNMPICYEIKGKIDLLRLKQAYQIIQERYDVFRTIFFLEETELKEKILDEPIIDFRVFDGEKTNISEVFKKFVSPFSLDTLPLTRMGVWECNNNSYLLFDFHHIITDGMSLEIFLGLFCAYYNYKSFNNFTDVPISNIHILQSLEEQKKYWLGIFKNVEMETGIVADYPRKAGRSFCGNTIFYTIPEDLQRKVEELGKNNGCTEFMVYFSIYMILLSRYSMKNEVIVGIPVSGRTNFESEKAMGMFVNTLAIKGIINEDESFTSFLYLMKNQLLDAFLNQDYPFYRLISDLGLSGQIADNPLFNNFFVYQNYNHNKYYLDSNEMKEIRGLDKISKFDLTLEIFPDDDGKVICLEYSTELYKYSTVNYFLMHYIELLKNVVNHPEFMISKLKCTTTDEELLIKEKFNKVEKYKYPTMHFADLFEKNVNQIPDKIAAVYNTEEISYKELNEKGNAVATLLRLKMQQDACIIPFVSARGIEMIIGIVGINKAGYAFLNIDYTLPVERIKFMLSECGANCILVGKTNDNILNLIKELNIDTIELEKINSIENNNIVFSRKCNSLAYIMYTSGTTGRPKGVMLENDGMVAFSQYIGEKYCFTTNTTILQSTTYSFDPFIIETMPALLFGAKIVVMDDNMMLDPLNLVRYMNEHGVTVVDFCPTILGRISDYLGQVKSLSIVMSGGEVLPNDLKNKILNYGIRLFNHYGPTEVTVDATIQECTLEKNVTLGFPIPLKNVFIINNDQLAGIGIPGEICISGVGISRGYLGQEKAADTAFFKDKRGNRYYRTGDIGKWEEHGEITYLGRQDKQIKILGHRIEVAEIEECIRNIESVEDAVVINDNENLIAYYVCKENINECIIQEKLKKSLPFYMIPNYWIKIDSIPYTINGKIDVHSLPIVQDELYDLDEKLTEIEKKVSDMFMDILEHKNISKYDNFFRKGGNSLKAAVLLNRIKRVTNCTITLRSFFENPTVNGVCNILSSMQKTNDFQIDSLSMNQFIYNENEFVATPQQKRLFIIQYNNPNYTGYNMTRCFLFKENINIKKMEGVLNEILKKNEILRTNFIFKENEIYSVVKNNIYVDIKFKQLEKMRIEDVVEEFVKPFDLSKDCLLRSEIIRMQSKDYFLLDIHHIISDGISIEMLLEDIIGGYTGTKSISTRKQYRDYSLWLNSKENKREELFWKSRLSKITERTELCKDYIETTGLHYNGKVIIQDISSDLTMQIKEFCIINKCSEYAYFMAGFLILLNRYCLNDKIIIASPFSGRTDQEYEDALGFFVNTLFFCESVSENEFFLDLLCRVKNNVWDMQDNQNFPYEKMCNLLGISEKQAMDSITDVLFVMQNINVSFDRYNYIEEVEVLEKPEIDYKIIVEVQEKCGCYKILFTYASDLYNKKNMEYFIVHYINILKNILLHYEKQIQYINEQDDAESELAILKGESFDLQYKSVKEIFENFTDLYPENLAIFDNYESLTYLKLNQKANQLSAFFSEKGLKKGDRIILYADKCIETIITILACLKSGIIYIPVDIEWPIMRIKYIIDAAKTNFLLLISGDKKKYEEINNGNIAVFEYPYTFIEQYNDVNPCIDIDIHDPAYIIFTSGTTGNPKGVQVNQEGIINLWQQNQLVKGITGNDKVLQFSSISFDALISELIMSVFSGASLAVIKENYRRDLAFISEYIVQNNITIGLFPPHVVSSIPIESLRCVITAGEEISNIEYKKIVEAGCDYWNEYGPTEGTVCTTMWNNKMEKSGYRVPIGQPICNVNVSIVKNGKTLGIGMLGEICVEGRNVADGYIEQGDVKNIFQKHGKSYYSTGDIGRILPNHVIEFWGRKDRQVKINGFRIELGEIESVVKMEENIDEAVAYIYQNSNKKEIILIFTSKKEVDLGEVRYNLTKKLPLYMIPNKIQQVDSIPLTLNGKVDIEKITKLINSYKNCMERTITEEGEEILRLIRDILHREDIGERDNFFAVGGTSIEAAFLLNRINTFMKKKISYYDFVICEDIYEFCSLVAIAPLVEETEIDQVKGIMSNAEKQIYLASMLDEKCTYNMPHIFRIKKEIDIIRLKRAFTRIISENDILHTIFWEDNGTFHKQVLENYSIDFKYQVSDIQLNNNSIKKYIHKFDLQNDALIRMIVVKEPLAYLLFIDAHHIIFDKESWNQFFVYMRKYYMLE